MSKDEVCSSSSVLKRADVKFSTGNLYLAAATIGAHLTEPQEAGEALQEGAVLRVDPKGDPVGPFRAPLAVLLGYQDV